MHFIESMTSEPDHPVTAWPSAEPLRETGETGRENGRETSAEDPSWGDSPLARLDPGDRALIVDFVLCSGSLKALAKQRGVSYPTIRGRLDRLIERLRGLVEGKPVDPVAETLAGMVERGELSQRGAREVLEVVRSKGNTGSHNTDRHTAP